MSYPIYVYHEVPETAYKYVRILRDVYADGGRHSPGDRVNVCGGDRASGVPDADKGTARTAAHRPLPPHFLP